MQTEKKKRIQDWYLMNNKAGRQSSWTSHIWWNKGELVKLASFTSHHTRPLRLSGILRWYKTPFFSTHVYSLQDCMLEWLNKFLFQSPFIVLILILLGSISRSTPMNLTLNHSCLIIFIFIKTGHTFLLLSYRSSNQILNWFIKLTDLHL